MLYIQDMFGLSYLRKKFSRTDQYNKFVEKPKPIEPKPIEPKPIEPKPIEPKPRKLKHRELKPSDNKVHSVVINRIRILAEKG